MTLRRFTTLATRWLAALGCGLLWALSLPSLAADEFLAPEDAFRFSARVLDERNVEVSFTIAPGYYLYRERFAFEAADARLGTPVIPPGKVKFDETFQKDVETHRGVLHIAVPVQQAPATLRLTVTSQGCADQGLCYPPMQSVAEVGLAGFGGDGQVRLVAASDTPAPAASPGARSEPATTAAAAPPNDGEGITAALRGGHFWTVVGVFFVAGLLLSLTPCVLPMLPILSSIIVGHGVAVSRGRGLLLAVGYSLGMALVYTALGIGAGLAGEGLAAALQNPWVLAVFALGLATLSLSMFGVYELQLPQAFTGRMASASQRLPAGRLAGVFAMGGVSALIVSPCVAAPLAGALVYLSQTRDVWLGGSALFSLAAGMSVPLLLLGASAGALLPRAGAWMDDVKRVFGLLLLGVALWTVQTLLPAPVVLALWGVLGIALAALLGGLGRAAGGTPTRPAWRWVGAAVFGALGLMQLVGAASGGSDPLQPLAHLRAGGAESAALRFKPVASVAELEAALQQARAAGQSTMLDFYADWCVSCKEMERYTFSDPAVRQRLASVVLLKADVTGNSPAHRELLRRFGLFGPPGTIFFGAGGDEAAGTRVIGFQDAPRFLASLGAAGL